LKNRWGQNTIRCSYNKITHKLWKDEEHGGVRKQSDAHTTRPRTNCGRLKNMVGSEYHPMLIQQDHAQTVEGRRTWWGQKIIRCSYNKTTHFLWKDEEHGGVNTIRCLYNKITHSLWKAEEHGGVRIPFYAHTTRPRTSCGRSKYIVGSEYHPMLIQQDHAQTVEGRRTWWGQKIIRCSYNKTTHFLWKVEEQVGSEYHPMLIQQDHALPVEG